MNVPAMELLLKPFGYRLVEDAWEEHGRKTFLNSEDADYSFMKELESELTKYGFVRHDTLLRAFRHSPTGEVLEIEIGGPETSGHFLHHLKAE